MAGLNPTLDELRALVRATHLFARNYKGTAPSITDDREALECAFLRLEEALIDAMRKGVKELHAGSPVQHEKLIQEEIEKLDRPDWHEAFAVGRASAL
jgi:predicted transcriptional regulator